MSEPQITHWEGCWLEGLSHYGCAIAHIASLTVRAERGDARIAKLEALLGEAPHEQGCKSTVYGCRPEPYGDPVPTRHFDASKCSCFKSRAK